MFWFFGREACGILAPQPGIEPATPALEGEVLTTGLPGKSQDCCLRKKQWGLTLVVQWLRIYLAVQGTWV